MLFIRKFYKFSTYFKVSGANMLLTAPARSAGFRKNCTPRAPAETAMRGSGSAESSINVGKRFFIPTGLHPPRT